MKKIIIAIYVLLFPTLFVHAYAGGTVTYHGDGAGGITSLCALGVHKHDEHIPVLEWDTPFILRAFYKDDGTLAATSTDGCLNMGSIELGREVNVYLSEELAWWRDLPPANGYIGVYNGIAPHCC
jgi:hypothetical protein